MIRPEAKAQLMRWREVLAGAAGLVLGLWWLAGPGLLLKLPGAVLVLGGAALVWVGVQRARFRGAGGGAGAVEVDEGQITYFGPLDGGVVALRELSQIVLDPTGRPAHWRLRQPGLPELAIPVDAAGADALFDAFATLPGFRMEAALQARRRGGGQPIVIWRRDVLIPVGRTLH